MLQIAHQNWPQQFCPDVCIEDLAANDAQMYTLLHCFSSNYRYRIHERTLIYIIIARRYHGVALFFTISKHALIKKIEKSQFSQSLKSGVIGKSFNQQQQLLT